MAEEKTTEEGFWDEAVRAKVEPKKRKGREEEETYSVNKIAREHEGMDGVEEEQNGEATEVTTGPTEDIGEEYVLYTRHGVTRRRKKRTSWERKSGQQTQSSQQSQSSQQFLSTQQTQSGQQTQAGQQTQSGQQTQFSQQIQSSQRTQPSQNTRAGTSEQAQSKPRGRGRQVNVTA